MASKLIIFIGIAFGMLHQYALTPKATPLKNVPTTSEKLKKMPTPPTSPILSKEIIIAIPFFSVMVIGLVVLFLWGRYYHRSQRRRRITERNYPLETLRDDRREPFTRTIGMPPPVPPNSPVE